MFGYLRGCLQIAFIGRGKYFLLRGVGEQSKLKSSLWSLKNASLEKRNAPTVDVMNFADSL